MKHWGLLWPGSINQYYPSPDQLRRSQRSADPGRGVETKRKSRFIGELNIEDFMAQINPIYTRIKNKRGRGRFGPALLHFALIFYILLQFRMEAIRHYFK